MRWPRPLLVLVGFAACDPYGPFPDWDVTATTEKERIAVTPGTVPFGTLSVNERGSATATLLIANLGEGTVTVTGHDEPRNGDVFAVDAEPLLVLAAGEQREVALLFAPLTEGEWAADLLIEPGDERVRLTGAATAPVIAVEGTTFDPVVLGCSGVGTVTVRNDGSEFLAIQQVETLSTEFTVLSAPDGVAPDTSEDILLEFTPAGGGDRVTSALLSTNDPLTPEVSVGLSVLAYEGERVRETFHYTPSNPTDLLFVIDAGEAMDALTVPAGAAIDVHVAQLRSTNIDYHLAALATGSACPGRTPGWAERTDTSLQTASVLERGFAGDGGEWDDDLLGLALTALEDTAGCLTGFRREEADLHVIAVTDGPAPADLASDVTTLAAAAEPPAGFRLSVLVPLTATCGEVQTEWRDAADTTGGFAADLCGSDWTSAFADFATLPPGADPVHYVLAEAPVPSTIEVTVEGTPFTTWTYDAESNAVRFDGDAVPSLGAQVDIAYVRAVACDG